MTNLSADIELCSDCLQQQFFHDHIQGQSDEFDEPGLGLSASILSLLEEPEHVSGGHQRQIETGIHGGLSEHKGAHPSTHDVIFDGWKFAVQQFGGKFESLQEDEQKF